MSTENTVKEIRYVGVKENLAYGFANAGQVFGYNLVAGGYLSLFFTKVFGIPEEAVALMIFILGIWDTVNDPLMGSIIDKTRTRFGKLRPYLMIVPIPLSIATIMLFAGPEILADAKSTTVKIVYMYISYFIWEFFYTIGTCLSGVSVRLSLPQRRIVHVLFHLQDLSPAYSADFQQLCCRL